MDYLPVFLQLSGRRVLVVGGGVVAARKVELLRQAAATVRVVAPALHATLQALRDRGEIEYREARFTPSDLDDTVFVIAATDEPAVNRAVAEAATARSLFVNVVDDAASSTCILPAIVDRSPVIVAVGTSAHSPILARRLRAQLEGWLPERLGELARFAATVRARVRVRLPDPLARRQFWEQLFEGPVASAVLAGRHSQAERDLETQLQGVAAGRPPRGEVYLIGAGPGDPDLLTLRAQQLLQQADVVLYDRLVGPAVLARVRREAERIFVGKESGQHRTTQARIHALLLEHARRGVRVARLKGGDPFVFGRGGEELELLRREGIPVTIVPGITAALGAAASAQLPLTHRGLSHAVTLVTAMGEGAEGLDWRALAAPLQTVVIYMGVAQLARIVERLVQHGAPAERPAAIIERATLPGERIVTGTLAQIVERAQAAQVGAPALLIVGDVAVHSCLFDRTGSASA